MEELLKLIEIVRQEAPQARVKVDSLMVTHYFTMEELMNICNKYADYKCALVDVVGKKEQLTAFAEYCKDEHGLFIPSWMIDDYNKIPSVHIR